MTDVRALDAEEAIRQLVKFMRIELDRGYDGPAAGYVIGERTQQAVRRALRGTPRKRP